MITPMYHERKLLFFIYFIFFFNDTATTEIYTLSLHDALPISRANAEKVARLHGIPKVCDTPGQLLDDPSIEVLDIAVPPMHQLALIKNACERKTLKGILAQKPLGMNYAESVEAVETCEKSGIVLAVNQNMRDRKSTRLNSSHGYISYAVFCLETKNAKTPSS